MTLEEKEYFLTKTNYQAKDIMRLLEIEKTQATKIIKLLKAKYGGEVAGRPICVKAESFWRYEGTTIECELRKLGYAKGYAKV